jgi:glycerol kinase
VTDELVLAVDQGTTNTKALVLGADGTVRAASSVRVGIEFPRPGWAQSDAQEIWDSVRQVIADCVEQVPAGAIRSIGISNQRESVVAWERASGAVLGPVVSWQCGRTADRCAELRAAGHEDTVRRHAGLVLDPMFAASKMAWLLDAIDGGHRRAADGEICVGTVDSWLLWQLTAGATFATDLTNASRTLLLDLTRGEWDEELVAVFDVPRPALASIQPTMSHFGTARLDGIDGIDGVPIGGVAGDSHAALVGHRALAPGAVKATFGTGTSVMAPVPSDLRSAELSSTIAWSRHGSPDDEITYAIEGNIYATGSALEWTADLLGFAGDVGVLDATARTCETSAGVCFVPAFSGLGAPHWEPGARGLISGLTRAAGPPEVSRAAFEAVAHQVADVLDRVEHVLGTPIAQVHADGGAIRSDLLAELVAGLSGIPVLRCDEPEVAAVGAALLAGVHAGIWPDLASTSDHPWRTTRFEPGLAADDRDRQRSQWAEAVRRAVAPGQG